ncbi:MAG: ABC transporter substrate-binding protein [Betaproteobacteria bacterium]
MKRWWMMLLLALPVTLPAQETVKVGVVMSFSGPFAVYGEHTKRGIDLYLDEAGGKAGNTRIEAIYRDEAGGPEKAKQVTQELIVRDGVQFLAGFNLSPNALAVAPLISQAKMPTVILTAGTSVITRRSPYFARISFTVWQGSYTLGEWAARAKVGDVVIAYSDYAPGHDAREAFKTSFLKGGGKVLSEIGMPLQTNDFGPYMQRIRDLKPVAVYLFTPAGPPGVGFMKTFSAYGLRAAGVKLLTTASVDELELPAIGEDALGAISAWHYSPHLATPENQRFVAAYRRKYPDGSLPTFQVVAAYDGMRAIGDVVAKLGAKFDADQAMAILKGWKGASARGAIELDPVERDIIQNMYIRRVEKLPSGGLGNVAFETIPMVKDPWKLLNK